MTKTTYRRKRLTGGWGGAHIFRGLVPDHHGTGAVVEALHPDPYTAGKRERQL